MKRLSNDKRKKKRTKNDDEKNKKTESNFNDSDSSDDGQALLFRRFAPMTHQRNGKIK